MALCQECQERSPRPTSIFDDGTPFINKRLDKQRTRNHLTTALRNGVLRRADACQICGLTAKLEAHHHDYLRPLWVEWLCRKCHAYADKVRRVYETGGTWPAEPSINDTEPVQESDQTLASITRHGWRCEVCSHEWFPRKPRSADRSPRSRPRVCPNPKCHSTEWWKPKRSK